MIAWRYLRARRAEGGVSVMTWISLIGITLAVFALIATLAVRAGFRAEFVDTILGANAHVTVYSAGHVNDDGADGARALTITTPSPPAWPRLPGVTRAAPLVKGQVMVTAGDGTNGAEVFGIRARRPARPSRASASAPMPMATSTGYDRASPSARASRANWA